MGKYRNYARWLKRGRQRSAVAQAIRQPVTSTQILSSARQSNPRIRLRDVWFLLRQMEARGLVHCLTPLEGNGKLFFLTETGRKSVERAFGFQVELLPMDIDWPVYSRVVRAKVRRRVLSELGRGLSPQDQSKTASRIYRNLRDRNPVNRNRILCALQVLIELGLVICDAVTPNRRRKLYCLTETGKRIASLVSEPIASKPY